MRRWRIALFLILPFSAGCICVCEDACCNSTRVIELCDAKPKSTTVAYCDPAAK